MDDAPSWEEIERRAARATRPIPVSEADKQAWDNLRGAIAFGDTALVSTILKTGEPITLVCMVDHNGDGYDVTPLAVLITDPVFDLIEDPSTVH